MHSLRQTTKFAVRRSPALPRYSSARVLHRLNSTQAARCPNCSQPLPTALPACTKCWHISLLQPDRRLHDILNIPYHPNPFNIDQAALKRNFRLSQATCHPDTWTSKGDKKRLAAELLSSEINNAYQTLLKPLARVEYLLRVNSHPLEETDKMEDMEFLGDIMMAREEIQSAETQEELEQVQVESRASIEATLATISQLTEAQEWEKLKEQAIKLRYLEGIQRAVEEWTPRTGTGDSELGKI